MVFLNNDEYTPLNIHGDWQLVSDHYTKLHLEISITSDQIEIKDDKVEMRVRIYNIGEKSKEVLYDWHLPTNAKFLRDISYDISMRLMDTAKYGNTYCLERFMHDYFIFCTFDEESGFFRFQSTQVSENGVSTLESFPRTITDLLKEDIHLQHWIQITKKTFKEIAEFSCEAAKECNRYYYLIMHVLPPEVITEFKKAVKK